MKEKSYSLKSRLRRTYGRKAGRAFLKSKKYWNKYVKYNQRFNDFISEDDDVKTQ